MGRRKRNSTIIISDDDDKEDEDFSISKLKNITKSASVGVNPKRSKRATITNSFSRLYEQSYANGFDEIKRFCEEFDEGITGCKVFAGCGRSKDLWVEKYKPQTLEDLAVHKKKVEEVKTWLEERLISSTDKSCNFALLIAGPAGAGKSATVHAVASHLGTKVFEWNAPTPTIWHEHLHNSNSGLRYMSKLDEFENFVEKIRKYGSIHSSLSGGAQTSLVLLMDDLPVVNGKVAYGRLRKCLHLLVQLVCIPTVILINEDGKANSADYNTHNWEELQLSLQNAGACKVTLNPVTANSIKKTLLKICKLERCEVRAEQLDLIAKSSGGDIRHAITSLQYFCLKTHPMPLLSSSKRVRSPSRKKLDEISLVDSEHVSYFGKDETLSLFHALGKFLHNKRENEHTIQPDMSQILLKDKFLRFPLKMDAPELVLCHSHGQAGPTADFLHENENLLSEMVKLLSLICTGDDADHYRLGQIRHERLFTSRLKLCYPNLCSLVKVLDFLNEEAIDDAWVVASYLSDADFLLASLNGRTSRSFEDENVVQSAAASVAVRGVLFGNSHPAPPRWHAIRRPKLWQVEQSLWRNKHEMVRERWDSSNGPSLSDPSVFCTELKPILKWLESRRYGGCEANQVYIDDMLEDETLNGGNLDDKNETSEDEIEED